ncbi:MAG: type IIL restriction-modification enzyme MmeI [Spirochaetota bacterium]
MFLWTRANYRKGRSNRSPDHFEREHEGDRDEKSQAQTFWRDFFAIFCISPQRVGQFEAKAKTAKGNVGFMDFFWPGTLLVEHKSRDKDLDVAIQQALDYCLTGGIKESEQPRFIIVSDFDHFRIIDLVAYRETGVQLDFAELRLDEARITPIYTEFPLAALHENLHRFNFILGYEQRVYKDEDPVNIEAAELIGRPPRRAPPPRLRGPSSRTPVGAPDVLLFCR